MKKKGKKNKNKFLWIGSFLFFCSHRYPNEFSNPISVGIVPFRLFWWRKLNRKNKMKKRWNSISEWFISFFLLTQLSMKLSIQFQLELFHWDCFQPSRCKLHELMKNRNTLLSNLSRKKKKNVLVFIFYRIIWILDIYKWTQLLFSIILFAVVVFVLGVVFFFLLQGFVWFFPLFVIEVGKLKDVLRADIALHCEVMSGHWFEPKQTKKVKIMNHICNNTNSNLWEWNLIIMLGWSR